MTSKVGPTRRLFSPVFLLYSFYGGLTKGLDGERSFTGDLFAGLLAVEGERRLPGASWQ